MPPRSRQIGLAILASLASAAITLGIGPGVADTASQNSSRQLKDVAAFQAITDAGDRSRALFTEAAKVITDPRCMNCHPVTRHPTQGDDMHPHVPFMNAGASGIGVDGLACSTCHRAENTSVSGSRLRSIPGNAHWSLAPLSMGWQGHSLGTICRQIKDPERNGGRSLAQIRQHLAEDHLVAWAWHPGEGRRPAPGTQAGFGALIAAWIETGAECPPE
ncbi:hypothetical protein KXS07_17330 [Inquilinus limosus]|uniref:hypothetical protein n=1 Tax=Inquilinus limosus TaxID=171674 RepID=UPI003F15E436